MNSNSSQSLLYFGVEGTGNNATRSIDLNLSRYRELVVNLNYDHGKVESESASAPNSAVSFDTWVNVAGVFDGANKTLFLWNKEN